MLFLKHMLLARWSQTNSPEFGVLKLEMVYMRTWLTAVMKLGLQWPDLPTAFWRAAHPFAPHLETGHSHARSQVSAILCAIKAIGQWTGLPK